MKAAPILFLEPIWFKLDEEGIAQLLIKPLNYKQIQSHFELSSLAQQDSLVFRRTTDDILIGQTLDFVGLDTFPDIRSIYKQLTPDQKQKLFDRLIAISKPDDTFLSELRAQLFVYMDDRFTDDNWKCTVCTERKLRYARACGFDPEDKRDLTFNMVIRGNRYLQCPISTLDNNWLSQATIAYRAYTSGLLMEDGALGSQTAWFVDLSNLYDSVVKTIEREYMEESRKGSK